MLESLESLGGNIQCASSRGACFRKTLVPEHVILEL